MAASPGLNQRGKGAKPEHPTIGWGRMGFAIHDRNPQLGGEEMDKDQNLESLRKLGPKVRLSVISMDRHRRRSFPRFAVTPLGQAVRTLHT